MSPLPPIHAAYPFLPPEVIAMTQIVETPPEPAPAPLGRRARRAGENTVKPHGENNVKTHDEDR